MDVARPAFAPDPDREREEMEQLQREIAAAATFEDDLPFDPGTLAIEAPVESPGEDPPAPSGADAAGPIAGGAEGGPVVAGVDQAFLDGRAVSAVVAIRDGAVVERVDAVVDLEIPYVPGLLAFREGPPILAALAELSVAPDLLVFDGSGRIHYRQAGIATHVGVVLDVPAVGVAKRLLCGECEPPLDGPLPADERVPVLADGSVDAPDGTVLGHAYQSRQYDSPDRHVNPLYVSPGHRVGAGTATDLVAASCAGYKLPEPTRLADRHAERVKERVAE